jgi:hypothetical protein
VSGDAYLGAVVVVCVFVGVGLLALGVAAAMALRYRRRARAGLIADARVIGVHPHTDSEGDTLYKSEFEFHDRRGAYHRVVSAWASAPARHQIGDRVRVSYEADRPETADVIIASRWLVAMAAFGVSMIAVMSLFYWAVATGRLVGHD